MSMAYAKADTDKTPTVAKAKAMFNKGAKGLQDATKTIQK